MSSRSDQYLHNRLCYCSTSRALLLSSGSLSIEQAVLKFFALIIIGIFVAPAVSYSSDSIHWRRGVPNQNLDPSNRTAVQIKTDTIFELVLSNMPAYRHEFIFMNWQRAFLKIQNKDKVCGLTAIKTPSREKVAYFSEPIARVMSYRLLMTDSRWQKLGRPHSYDFEKIAIDPDLRGIIVQGTSLTEHLDNALIRLKDHPDYNISEHNHVTPNLVNTLFIGSYDYIVYMPGSISSMVQTLDVETKLHAVKIEGVGDYVHAHAVCPKNSWGKTVIEKVDALLPQLRTLDKYRAASSFDNIDKRRLVLHGES